MPAVGAFEESVDVADEGGGVFVGLIDFFRSSRHRGG